MPRRRRRRRRRTESQWMFAAVAVRWATPCAAFGVLFSPKQRLSLALQAKRRKKEQSRADIDRWYDKVNEDASPDEIFWQEMERQKLQSRLSGSSENDGPLSSSAAAAAAAAAAAMNPNSEEGSSSSSSYLGGLPSTLAGSEDYARRTPTVEETRSAEATLAVYESHMVDNNWLDERYLTLEHDPVLLDLVRKSGGGGREDDDGKDPKTWNDDGDSYDGFADEEESQSDISDEYVTGTGQDDDDDEFFDEDSFIEEPWDTWGRNVTDDGVVRLSPSKISSEFLYDPEGQGTPEAAAAAAQEEEEEEFQDRLSWIQLRSRRLQRARTSARARAFFAREVNAVQGFDTMWVSAVDAPSVRNLVGTFRNYGIQFADNFGDWEYGGPEDAYRSIEDLASYKARQVYQVTGLPCIASQTSFEIEPAGTPPTTVSSSSVDGGGPSSPYAASRGAAAAAAAGGVRGVSPRVASGYRFNDVGEHVDYMVAALKPLSEPTRVTRFITCLCFYDGGMEIYDYGVLDCHLHFCSSLRTFVPMSQAIGELCQTLQMSLSLDYQKWQGRNPDLHDDDDLYGSARIRLRDRVLRHAKVLPNDIIDVSAFMDSMVDVELMDECGAYLGRRFADLRPTKILTVATTGLVIAIPLGKHLQVPVVYARKERNVVMADTYSAAYSSKTVGKNRELLVSRSHLDQDDRILIVDDFLSSGSSQEALLRIVAEAGAACVGVGVLLEKVYESGRQSLSGFNVPVESMVRVASVKDGILQLLEEDGYQGL